MKIVIIGAGFTGIQLAKRLINEKNDVVLIDNDEDIVRHASNRLDCTVISGNGNDMETLEEAGIAKADALVTLTEDDEINMITCSMVDSVYPSLLKIARVRNYAYYTNTSKVAKNHAESFSGKKRPLYGVDFMIHPDVEAAKAIVSAVEHGAVSDVFTFGEKFELIVLQIEEKSKFDGCQIKDLRSLTQNKFIVVFVETEEGSSLPSGDTILHAGDRIGILTEKENIETMLKLCGSKIDALKNITLVGAGRIGTIVADHILEKRSTSFLKRIFEASTKKIAQNFVIVDSDKNLCKEASDKFASARVLCGDITDEGFIQEESLDKSDLVICATHNHEMNMVISAYMESLGVQKTISLVEHSAFADIARKLGIEVPIPLRDTIVDCIMSHLKGKNVKGIHTVSGGAFEIVECDLQESSKFNGKALKDIASPGEYLMLLVRKHGQLDYELPTGNTVLAAKDHLVLIEKAGDKKILEKFSGTV